MPFLCLILPVFLQTEHWGDAQVPNCLCDNLLTDSMDCCLPICSQKDSFPTAKKICYHLPKKLISHYFCPLFTFHKDRVYKALLHPAIKSRAASYFCWLSIVCLLISASFIFNMYFNGIIMAFVQQPPGHMNQCLKINIKNF